MPASKQVVFDPFHYHCWRLRWDSLVEHTRVVGGASCPYVGAVTENVGSGILKGLASACSSYPSTDPMWPPLP